MVLTLDDAPSLSIFHPRLVKSINDLSTAFDFTDSAILDMSHEGSVPIRSGASGIVFTFVSNLPQHGSDLALGEFFALRQLTIEFLGCLGDFAGGSFSNCHKLTPVIVNKNCNV